MVFYTLPKIHKKYSKTPPGRPIVSSVDSPTEKISHFIDIILQPFAQAGASYIRDMNDFLDKVRNLQIAEDEWIFSMDVSSLYTNIPHHEGVRVIRDVLRGRTSVPSNDNILKMLNLVLKCNCFRFNNDFYLQINGTAMGTRVAPTYAIIFMNRFEETFVYSYPKRPRIWFRFIDDVWGVFKGSKDDFELFATHLNRVHDSIKFTYESSKTKVTFLDVTTLVINGKLETTLNIKETDNHGYLYFSSCHPYHNKLSIPYSQFLRIRRICSKWEYFAEHALKLTMYLSLRGYPLQLIEESLDKVSKMRREELKPSSKVSQGDRD